MASWLKKTFGKKKEEESTASPSSQPPPPAAGGDSRQTHRPTGSASSSNSRRNSKSSSTPILRPAPGASSGAILPPRGTRVSGNDLALVSNALGVSRPQAQPPIYPPNSAVARQQQQDADMALAYSMAQQEQQEALPPAVGYPASVPPRMFPQRPGFRGPDLQLATALADSEFAARQADEFARASEAVYQAAVSQAMEASLRTVDYDDVLRDIKLWSIDLAAATDDIHAALDSVVRQRAEVAAKLERAVMAGEERRVAKYTWQAEHLPEVERRLRDLGERLAPVGVAVAELQDLREHVVATSPPLQEAERTRDDIIARLFRSMGAAGLRMPPNNSASSTADGAGPSTGDAGQSPMDIRDLVAALIGEATRLPKMPRRKSSASSASISTGTRTPSLVEAAEVDAALTSHPVDQKVAGHGGKKERDDTPPSRAVADAEADSSYATQYMPSAPTDSRIPEEVLQKGNPSGNLIDLEAAHEGPGAVSNGFGHANGDAAGGLQVPPTPAPLISLEQGTGQSSPTLDADTTPTAPFSTVLSGGADAGRAMDSLALSPSTGGSDRSGTATTTPPSASSSGATPNSAFQRRKAFTVPVPFQLSTSRQRSKASSPVQVQAEPIRRVAAFVSLHYEIEKDRGVVAQAVAWKDAAKQRAPIDVGELPSAPSYAASFRPTQAEEMAEFVRSHGGFAGWEPTSSDLPPLLSFTATDRWSVMCAGSAAHAALSTAELRLSEWQVAPGTDGDAACQLLSAYMAGVTAHAATVAHAHDALRTALSKHGLPWDEELVPRLRWASQHAAAVVMHHALACAEDAERTRGTWQRQAMLRPLGQAVMATFPVHQLAGGFGGDASAACDLLVERTVYYARSIDPKWFRGHRVVA